MQPASGRQLLLASAFLAAAAAAAAAAARPHIVLVVADDLGFDDTSLHGADQIPTPNLDALALTGVPLRRYYVHALCTPSRAALLTGRLPTHTGLQRGVIYAAQPYGLGLGEQLLPQWLARLGYDCYAVGKWHLGFFRRSYTPTYRGFRSHFGYWAGHGDYYDHTAKEGAMWGLDLRRDMTPVRDALGRYSTRLFTDEAERLIAEHNTSSPMFLYVAHQAPHAGNAYAPLQAPADARARLPWIASRRRRTFAAMVTELDASLGRLVIALDSAGLLNSTLLVLTTDNGGAVAGVDASAGSNWPLRGGKYTMWEGGVRGLGFVWGRPLRRSAQLHSAPVHITDWLPTLYEAAGGQPRKLGAIDGVSQWRAISGDTRQTPPPSPPRNILHNIDPVTNYSALMSDRYKLILGQPTPYNGWYGWPGRGGSGLDLWSLMVRSPAGRAARRLGMTISRQQAAELRRQLAVTCTPHPPPPPPIPGVSCDTGCLFDVQSDPCETRDLSARLPEVREKLERLLAGYWSTMVPSRKRPVDRRADPRYWGYTWTNWRDFIGEGDKE